MPELILAVDVGTTSTRAAVVAPDGTLAGLSAAPLTSRAPFPGQVEQDAEAVWAATRGAIAAALSAAARGAADIAAVGVTTQRASAVIWDRATGEARSPLVVWSDQRGTARAAELAAAGFMLSPLQAATRLEAMFAAVDAPPAKLAWGNIDSFIIHRLSGGTHLTDRSQAWPCGYLSLPHLGWNEALIDHQGLDRSTFPRLTDTWGELATTSPEVLGAAVPIAADIADQQSALIAHGEAPGTAKMTFGTSGTFDLATGATFLFPAPSLPPLIVFSAGGETGFCIEGMAPAAGSAVDWARKAFSLGDHDALESLAQSVNDAAGAVFLPAARVALSGLGPSVSRAHLARAALEGVAFRAREIIENVYDAVQFPPPAALGVDGGMSRSGVFLQILADLIARPVRRHGAIEATLLGAAIAAGRGIGLHADAAAMIRFCEPVTPKIDPSESAARFAAWRAEVRGEPADP
ncbi:MAG TPA: FGGY family carbohydrate kinase [Caulobacteraceae bacterium]|jgi:glycerol kinase